MLILASTTDKLQLVTGAAGTINVHASWMDNVSGAIGPGRTNTPAITTATTTDIVGSPGAGVFRALKTLHIHNSGSSSNDITVRHTDGSITVELYKTTLAAGATLQYIDEIGFITPQVLSFSTGDAKLTMKAVADAGWIMMTDGTIGNVTSGATRPNTDTHDLFTLLFNNVNDTYAPLFIGAAQTLRTNFGGVAESAWNGNVKLTLTRQLGRTLAIAGAGAGLTASVLGQFDGSETHTITVAEVPSGLLSGGDGPGSSVIVTDGAISTVGGGGPSSYVGTGRRDVGGGGSPMPIVDPRAFWNVMIKL